MILGRYLRASFLAAGSSADMVRSGDAWAHNFILGPKQG